MLFPLPGAHISLDGLAQRVYMAILKVQPRLTDSLGLPIGYASRRVCLVLVALGTSGPLTAVYNVPLQTIDQKNVVTASNDLLTQCTLPDRTYRHQPDCRGQGRDSVQTSSRLMLLS